MREPHGSVHAREFRQAASATQCTVRTSSTSLRTISCLSTARMCGWTGLDSPSYDCSVNTRRRVALVTMVQRGQHAGTSRIAAYLDA